MQGSIGLNQKPNPKELEVSLFGPSYGECCVIHLGNGKWIIVDSCINKDTNRPAALDYLTRIGVDQSDVVMIVATHWHDDHVRGMGELFKHFPDAVFVTSVALNNEEFLHLAAVYGTHSTPVLSSGMKEFNGVLRTIDNTGAAFKFTGPDRLLWEDKSSNARVYALSPSDEAIKAGQLEIMSLIPAGRKPRIRRAKPKSPNVFAIALLVSIHDTHILLGADLTETEGRLHGWTEVLKTVAIKDIKCDVFKVPHHGSINAHLEQVWLDLLHPKPTAITTEFRKGKVKLPKPTDVSRIKNLAGDFYITSTQSTKLKLKQSALLKTIRNVTKSARHVARSTGHIQLRKPINNIAAPWAATLQNSAKKV